MKKLIIYLIASLTCFVACTQNVPFKKQREATTENIVKETTAEPTIVNSTTYSVLLAHFEFEPLVNDDYQVTPPTMLGMVGNTGYSDGYHLHMEVKKNGERIDPRDMFSEI